jgi:hypothetical protein
VKTKTLTTILFWQHLILARNIDARKIHKIRKFDQGRPYPKAAKVRALGPKIYWTIWP